MSAVADSGIVPRMTLFAVAMSLFEPNAWADEPPAATPTMAETLDWINKNLCPESYTSCWVLAVENGLLTGRLRDGRNGPIHPLVEKKVRLAELGTVYVSTDSLGLSCSGGGLCVREWVHPGPGGGYCEGETYCDSSGCSHLSWGGPCSYQDNAVFQLAIHADQPADRLANAFRHLIELGKLPPPKPPGEPF